MSSKICYATADIPRAIVALVFPVAAAGVAAFVFDYEGYAVSDIPSLFQAGELSWFRQSIGLLALLFWVLRYYPPAYRALVDGPCLIFTLDGYLYLPNARRVPLEAVKSIRVERRCFKKVAHVETGRSRIGVSLIFVRQSDDQLLTSLAHRR